MHTNDTHANLKNESEAAKVSAAKRVTAVNEFRATHPNALLLDAGDVFSGSLYFNEFHGLADLEFINLMKYDAMTFGNHEFDLGSSEDGHAALAEFVNKADFPFVSSNVDFSKDILFNSVFKDEVTSENPENGKIYDGIIKEINGEKVGIFGLTTEETKGISSPDKIEFENYIEEAEKAVKAFEAKGINKIIAITHLGYDDNPSVDNDQELAKRVDGIDIIVGGHTHTKLTAPTVINLDEGGKEKDPTVIVQAYQYNEFLGTLNVKFEDGKIIEQNGQLISIATKQEDPKAVELFKKYYDVVKGIESKEIGADAAAILENLRTGADNSLPSVRKNETALGNIIADGMLNKAKEYNSKVVMAFQNGGGIRSGIEQGPITVGEVIKVLPFGNTLATMDLTGKEIKAAFETSFKEFPKENGGFLHVAGAKVKFDSSKPAGQRVISVMYKNETGTYVEIDENTMYTIATNAFTAKGGDSYDVFKKAYEEGRVTDLGLSDWENFKDHLVQLKTVTPAVEGRILDTVPVNVKPGNFEGTTETPKTHLGNIEVNVTDLSNLENAVIKGDLVLKGTAKSDLSFSNIVVEGNLDVSAVESNITTFEGIEVMGELIL